MRGENQNFVIYVLILSNNKSHYIVVLIAVHCEVKERGRGLDKKYKEQGFVDLAFTWPNIYHHNARKSVTSH